MAGVGVDELVAYASVGEEHFGISLIILQLAAKAINILLDEAIVSHVFGAPHTIKYAAISDYLPFIAHQMAEHFILYGSQLNWLS